MLEVVIDQQVAGQPPVLFLGVWKSHGVGPFLAEGLDEYSSLALVLCVDGMVWM